MLDVLGYSLLDIQYYWRILYIVGYLILLQKGEKVELCLETHSHGSTKDFGLNRGSTSKGHLHPLRRKFLYKIQKYKNVKYKIRNTEYTFQIQ